jgi:hypothetical protein
LEDQGVDRMGSDEGEDWLVGVERIQLAQDRDRWQADVR